MPLPLPWWIEEVPHTTPHTPRACLDSTAYTALDPLAVFTQFEHCVTRWKQVRVPSSCYKSLLHGTISSPSQKNAPGAQLIQQQIEFLVGGLEWRRSVAARTTPLLGNADGIMNTTRCVYEYDEAQLADSFGLLVQRPPAVDTPNLSSQY